MLFIFVPVLPQFSSSPEYYQYLLQYVFRPNPLIFIWECEPHHGATNRWSNKQHKITDFYTILRSSPVEWHEIYR